MDGICKVKSCCSFLDAPLFAFRGKYKDICLDKVIVDHVKKIKGVDIRIDEDFLDLGDPFVHLALV